MKKAVDKGGGFVVYSNRAESRSMVWIHGNLIEIWHDNNVSQYVGELTMAKNRDERDDDNQNDEHLEFKSDRVFSPPLLGIYRGRTVKVQERGNTEGMSATFWITDQGKNRIVSLDQVVLIGGDFIAPSTQQLRKILQDELSNRDND